MADEAPPPGVEQHPSAPSIPGYILVRPLGRGAFAEVWKAWQRRTRKDVAVKVFTQRAGINWEFLRHEVERLVKLDRHPNVVSLLDADLSGDPGYFVMDLLESGSLEGVLAGVDPADADSAAAWMEDAARALAYVHSKGIIHCDLKPANILLDDERRVRVADFGQSRAVTESAGAMGSLFYLAPEQAGVEDGGEAFQADMRWDVFALGATMYGVLSGKPPYSEHRAQLEAEPALRERLRAYRRLAMEAPLADLRLVARGAVDEDLAAIIAKCAAPDPEGRYLTMAEVVGDLERRRRRLPVSPLAAGRLYRARRFLQRNTALVALCAAFSGVLLWGAAQIVAKNRAMKVELAASYRLRGRQAAMNGEDGDAALLFAKSNAIVPTDGARRDAAAFLAGLARPSRTLRVGRAVEAVALSPDGSRALARDGQDHHVLWDPSDGRELFRGTAAADQDRAVAYILSFGGPGRHVPAFSPDGSRALVDLPVAPGIVTLAEAATLRPIAQLPGRLARFSPQGGLLAVSDTGAGPGQPGGVRLYRASDGRPTGVSVLPPGLEKGGMAGLEFSRDGKLFLAITDRAAAVWDARTGRPAGRPLDLGSRSTLWGGVAAEFSPDGRTILVTHASQVRVYDRATGRPIGRVMEHKGGIAAAHFTKDGKGIVTVGGEDGELHLWYGTGESAGRPADLVLLRHPGKVRAAAMSPDGARIATAGEDGTAHLWDLASWSSYGGTMLHGVSVNAVAFSADGKTLVTGAQDGSVRTWPVPEAPSDRTSRRSPGNQVHFAPGAAERVVWDAEGGALVEETATGRVLARGFGRGNPLYSADFRFDRDGRRFLAVEADSNETSVWEARTGAKVAGPLRHRDNPAPSTDPPWSIWSADLSQDGRLAVSAASDGRIVLWDLSTGKPQAEMPADDFISDLRFSPDGRRLAVAGTEKTLVFALPLTGKPELTIPGGHGTVLWSPDGLRLATTDDNAFTVKLWDALNGRALGEGLSFAKNLAFVRFSPDGGRLAAGSWDSGARLLDARSGDPVGGLLRHLDSCHDGVFSPDGSVLATSGEDFIVRLWDAKTGEPLGHPLWQGNLVNALAFSADGRTLYADGLWHFMAWDVSWLYRADSPQALLEQAEALDGRRVGSDGLPRALPPP